MFEILIAHDWWPTLEVRISALTEYDCPEFDIAEHNPETIFLEATLGEEGYMLVL